MLQTGVYRLFIVCVRVIARFVCFRGSVGLFWKATKKAGFWLAFCSLSFSLVWFVLVGCVALLSFNGFLSPAVALNNPFFYFLAFNNKDKKSLLSLRAVGVKLTLSFFAFFMVVFFLSFLISRFEVISHY